MRAQNDALARGLGALQPDERLAPLAFGVDEVDDRDRHVADLGGERDDVVVDLLGRRVEDVQLAQASRAALGLVDPRIAHME